MGRFFAITGIVAAVAAVFAWNFYFKPRRDAGVEVPPPAPSVREEAPADAPPARDEAPEPQPAPVFVPPTPSEEAPPPVELPPLDASDDAVAAALDETLGAGSVAGLFVPEALVRKLVVTVDNLPRDALSMKIRAIGPIADRFVVAGEDDDLALDPDNFARYERVLARLEATDPSAAADLYVTGYPLLQQAYEELGYPGGQFHDRLFEVIDHLLDAPMVDGAMRLTRPHVLYRFADPELEALSSGQKILLRMGPENRARVQDWLVRFRAELEARELS